jgi:hypothetical protein
VNAPSITRLSDDGPWKRFRITNGDPERFVVIFADSLAGQYRIDHTIDCCCSLHEWPDLFEAYRGYRDIPKGFELTHAGRALFVEADGGPS